MQSKIWGQRINLLKPIQNHEKNMYKFVYHSAKNVMQALKFYKQGIERVYSNGCVTSEQRKPQNVEREIERERERENANLKEKYCLTLKLWSGKKF